MTLLSTIRTFRTRRFTVTVEALDDPRPDLSWDDGEVEQALEDGTVVAFCAHATVRLDERIIAEHYLSHCLSHDYAAFENHRERRGSYFASLVRLAIRDARQTLKEFQQVHIRERHRRLPFRHLQQIQKEEAR